MKIPSMKIPSMKIPSMKIPVRYLPFGLNNKDSEKQVQMLKKSRSNYKKGKYFTRKPIKSFHSRPSKHLGNAQKIYRIQKIVPSKELAKATGCSIDALEQIVKKGEGAYFSSGSRPNQTAQSWGYARLASSLTAGKAAAVDFKILEKGCNHRGKAFTLAKKARRQFGDGHGRTRRRIIA
jgi:DNA-binding Xre family transcriptional regulator